MKKNSVKKIVLIIVLFIGICVISNVNYASGDINALLQNIIRLPELDTTEQQPTTEQPTTQQPTTEVPITEQPTTQQPTTQQPTTTEVPTTTETPSTENTNEENKTLPKTGVDDTALWILIAVSVVAAGYTYKKVRDYNV